MRLESSFRIALNWPEIGKMTMTSQFANMMPSSVFFDVLFLLSKFSYWSKFHVNIITGSGDMTIYFYKGLTRNPEIGNTPVWVLPNNSRLGRVTNTKISTHVSNEMLLNTAKCQGYSFYRFWDIKGKFQSHSHSFLPILNKFIPLDYMKQRCTCNNY